MASKHTPYFNLLDALKEPGCALCRLGRTAVERYLTAILYESVIDPNIQQTLAASHGLCPAHSEQIARQRDTLGTAILYDAILAHLLEELPREAPSRGEWLDRLGERFGRSSSRTPPLAPHLPCPACRQRDETASRALEILEEHHADPELVAALKAGSGFCLPHVRQALASLNRAASDLLLSHQREAWQHLRADLAELIRKNDYRFRDEGFGAEGDAWLRAVRAVTGESGVF